MAPQVMVLDTKRNPNVVHGMRYVMMEGMPNQASGTLITKQVEDMTIEKKASLLLLRFSTPLRTETTISVGYF